MTFRKLFFIPSAVIILIYLILLIPETAPDIPSYPSKEPFVWDSDSLWFSLEKQFLGIKNRGGMYFDPGQSFNYIDSLLNSIDSVSPPPGSDAYAHLENAFFRIAPAVAALPECKNDYFRLYAEMRYIVKDKSITWDMNDRVSRDQIYRLLYGGRAAVEEIMLQNEKEILPPDLMGSMEFSATPQASMLGVGIHSGDILISRGGAPTSALIARGNDYPGNFSHVALVYINEKTHDISVIESHIEKGVTVSGLEEYLNDKKLRVMMLRLRSDLPPVVQDPMLPHKAALLALNRARSEHIPYDFEMNYKDSAELFCSEVAYYPYSRLGINFWKGISHISSSGVVSWLASFGVKHFETQEPSDLEYDPQLRVVAEWRDPETLFKDHIDNAVIEAMLERANEGKQLEYPLWKLPLARVVKLYSSILNAFGSEGIIPEGMSAAAALRNEQMSSDHAAIRELVKRKAAQFRLENNYIPPYWQLVRFAGQAVKEIGY